MHAPPEPIICVEGALDPTNPWALPEGAPMVPLATSTTGGVPRLQTRVGLGYDATGVRIVFVGEDDASVVATMFEHDDPLWKEDVFEVFLAPVVLTEYFELELSPRATRFDARISSPDGSRHTMKTDLGWSIGWKGFVRRDRTHRLWQIRAALHIPFEGLVAEPPESGESWFGNFFRIDRSDISDEFTAWSPTGSVTPDFHIPSRFGEIRFAGANLV